MLTRNQRKKRKRDKNSFLLENLPPRKRRKKISGGLNIIKKYLRPLFNENKTEYQEFRKKHKVTITDLNNINVILTKIRCYHNDDYDYLKRNLNEGKKPPTWNSDNLDLMKKEVPTRAQQLIYIAIGFLQKNNKTIKDYMEKKSKRASELSKRRAKTFSKKRRRKRKKVKKIKKTKKTKPVPIQTNPYNTRTHSKRQSFFTKPTPKYNPALFNFPIFNKPTKAIKPFDNNLNLPPINIPNNNIFNPQNLTPNRVNNLSELDGSTFFSREVRQSLNHGFHERCEPTEFERKLNNLFLT